MLSLDAGIAPIKSAGALLIAAFTAILALRTLVKRVMAWEEAHLQGPAGTR